MRNSLLLLASFTFLTACGQMNNTKATPEEVMADLQTPQVEGVNSTMLRMAQEAEQQGNYAYATQTYQQILDKNPQNAAIAIRYGENLRKSGEANKALSVFQSVLNQQPKNLDALEGKGLALLSLADTDAAGKVLNQVMDQSSNRWRTLNAVGILFTTKGLYEDAQQYFNAALDIENNHPAILNNRGLVLALDRQYSRALESLFAASKNANLPIHQVQADLNAALIYAIAGDSKQAEKMAARHLSGATLQNNLGLYALIAEDRELAKTHLHMALSESKVFYEKAWDNLERLDATTNTSSSKSGKRVRIGEQDSQPMNEFGLPIAPDKNYYHPSTSSTAAPSAPAPAPAPVTPAESTAPINEPTQVVTPPSASAPAQHDPFGDKPDIGSFWGFSKDNTPEGVSEIKKDEGNVDTKASDSATSSTLEDRNVDSGFEALGDFITNW